MRNFETLHRNQLPNVTDLDPLALNAHKTIACEHPKVLATILRDQVQLSIWKRTLPLCLTTWLKNLPTHQLPNLRILARHSELKEQLERALDHCEMPEGPMRRIFVADIGELVSHFAAIVDSDYVDIRLETVTHNSCWKFHRDYVEARLLTTYLGPATEWVQPDYSEQALLEQMKYSGPIERMKTHHVSIFKGSCLGTDSGVVHRSPPIAGTGQTRVLLCLNKQTATSPAPTE